jgi:hypothetical protein
MASNITNFFSQLALGYILYTFGKLQSKESKDFLEKKKNRAQSEHSEEPI